MIQCLLCKQGFKTITNSHLRSAHSITVGAYIKKFGSKGVGFFVTPSLLPKGDPRYKKWKQSLEKRPSSWSKGFTKETHPSLAKTSRTFRKKKIDNFATWRQNALKTGLVPYYYPPLSKTETLAFLHGLTLGDGHIGKFPRTESLILTLGTDKPELWQYAARVVQDVFGKKPKIRKQKNKQCMVLCMYQKNISRRLCIPTGSRKNIFIRIPFWIRYNKIFLIQWLRGLYEAEGSFCVHEPTYTYKLIFSNKNESLLRKVFWAWRHLGFNPHQSKYKVQISRRKEVYAAKDLINFREYD